MWWQLGVGAWAQLGGGAGFSGRGVEGCWRGGEVTGSKVADS